MFNRILGVFLFVFLFSIFCFSQSTQDLDKNLTRDFHLLKVDSLPDNLLKLQSYVQEAESFKNDSLIAKSHTLVGLYYDKKNEVKLSIEQLEKALAIYKKTKNYKKQIDVHLNIAVIHTKISNYEKALVQYFDALRLTERLHDAQGTAHMLNDIGNIYLRTKDLVNAKVHLKRALEINKANNFEKSIVENLVNLGVISQKTNNLKEALQYFNLALDKAIKLDLKISQSILLGNIGSTNRSLKNYELSLHYLFRALKLKKELQRFGSIAYTCSDIAETYLLMKEYTNAKFYAKETIKFAKNNNLELERYGYFVLSKCNYKLGDFKNSYDNLMLYNKLNDSIFNNDKVAAIGELEIKYTTEKRIHTIKEQQSNIALLNEQNKVKNQWMLFGGLSLIGFFGTVLLWRSRNAVRKKEQLQEKFSQDLIIAQEAERTRISKDLHDSVGQQLTLIKKKAQKLNQDELSEMSNTALEEVRSISRDLYPATLKQLGFSQSVEQLVNDLDEGVDMFFTVEVDAIDDELNEEKALNLYRFIQEALSNVIKHSNAKAVSVIITRNANQIETTINDNGIGFNSSVLKNSLGLKTMVERIKMMKGTLSINSNINNGTTLIAQIPV